MKVYTEEKLAEAVKNNEDYIEIEGDLSKKVIKIRATGKVAWAIAIGAISIGVLGIIAAVPTGGTATIITSGLVAPAAIATLGTATTISAITIAVTAGGVGVLNSLRSYKEVSRTQNSITLQRKA